MGTRAQIGIYEGDISKKYEGHDFLVNKWDVLLYQHWDGYPEGVIPNILPFIKHFIKVRGSDTEYLGASLLTWLKVNHGETKNIQNPENVCPTGHGISKMVHSDIEYFYAIDSKNIYVFEVSCWEEPYSFNLIETHSLEPVLVEK